MTRLRSRSSIGALVAVALATACAAPPQAVTEPDPVASTGPGTYRVTLAPGQSATLGGATPVRVTLRGVEEDSRCPVGVQCVWAGDAAVTLRLERDGRSAGTTLHTTLEPRAVRFDDTIVVRLVEVSPAPREGAPVRAEDYRVTIEVGSGTAGE